MINPKSPAAHHRRHPSRESQQRWHPAIIASVAMLLCLWMAAIDINLRTWHDHDASSSSPSPIQNNGQSRTIDGQQRYYLRSRRLVLSTIRRSGEEEQNEQWKTKRKLLQQQQQQQQHLELEQQQRGLYNKTEWEDDDDDDVPFHLEDDDATNAIAAAAAAEASAASDADGNKSDADADAEAKTESADEKTADTTKSGGTTKEKGGAAAEETPSTSGKGEEEEEEQSSSPTTMTKETNDEGLVYSDNVGSKEANPLEPSSDNNEMPNQPPPPPPPSSPDNNSTKSDPENATTAFPSPLSAAHKIFDKTSHTIPTHNHIPNYEPQLQLQGDTIFDDLLRGFTFAFFFCLSVYCSYKCCWYTCVRCGFFPDERVMEARWRLRQLKKKRQYHKLGSRDGHNGPNGDDDDDDDISIPPMDTRLWGKWMANRADMNGDDGNYYYSNINGVWDCNTDNESVWEVMEDGGGGGGDDDNNSRGSGEEGFVEFDYDLPKYEDHHHREEEHGIEMAGIELEYGEGEELEDKSHDSRLFDDVDGGLEMEREADKFFRGGSKKNGENGKTNGKKKKPTSENGKKKDSGIANRTNGDVSSDHQLLPFAENDIQQQQNQTGSDGDADEDDDDDDVSDASFFDALQPPPSTRKSNKPSATPTADKNGTAASSSAAKDFVSNHNVAVGDLLDMDGNKTNIKNANNNQEDAKDGNDNNNGDDEAEGDTDTEEVDLSSSMRNVRSSMILEAERGYDEETDLLGLRSDSPPPLDLEEIEKNLMANMEQSNFY